MTEKRTPLTDRHERFGAKMAPFAGYSMPIQYAGILAEHDAVRHRAGIFDVSHMGHCEIRDTAVSRRLSRPLEKMAVGRSAYALIMNESGGIVDDCISYRLEESLWHTVLNASRKEVDVATLGNVAPRFDWAMIALQGPQALALVGGELCPRRGFARDLTVLGVPVYLTCRTGYTGEDGFEFIVAPDRAGELWDRLLAAGAAPCGLGSRDLLRIEAALPLYGLDISETIDPFEAGLGFAVDLASDFIARAALSSPKARRRRAGLTVPKGAVPRHDYPVLDAQRREIGKVTSGTFSPLLDQGIALALVEADTKPAFIRIRNQDHPATEVDLPFYRRKR